MLKGQADPSLLDSYQVERAPIGKQVVDRANKSIEEFGPIFQALGLLDTKDPVKMIANMAARKTTTPKAEEQRAAMREAIAYKVYEFDCAWRRDEPALQIGRGRLGRLEGSGLQGGSRAASTSRPPVPGARLPHVWVEKGDAEALHARSLRQGPLHAAHLASAATAGSRPRSAIGKATGLDIAAVKIGPGCD